MWEHVEPGINARLVSHLERANAGRHPLVVRQYVLETVLECKSVAFAASPVHVFVVDDITNDATGKDATQLLPHEYGEGGG